MNSPFALLELDTARQLNFALYALALGAAFGALYDVFRIGRVACGFGVRGAGGADRFGGICLPLIGSRDSRRARTPRIFRRSETALTFIADLLFFAAATPVYAVFIYHAQYGEPRLYLAVCAAAGFAAYYFTLGRAVMLVARALAFAAQTVAAYALFFILKPFALLYALLSRAVSALVGGARRSRDAARSRRLDRELLDGLGRFITEKSGWEETT